ncbi:MAG: helix-turn-helix transcriptional regulator, partial [Clostridia bacterium]|nr:helix-turn-helix transcriptional regulator [Clostridia bacterium]
MILADKIIKLRKQNGWSQEELASQLGVSRQSVSKWEGAQSVPDLNKILKLGEIFHVSTDYLLKDEIEEIIEQKSVDEPEKPVDDGETVSMTIGEVTEFFVKTNETSVIKALSFGLMVLSPVWVSLAVLFDALFGENPDMVLVSMIMTIATVFAGIVLMFFHYFMDKKYNFLSTQNIELEYGGAGVAENQRDKNTPKYKTVKLIGIILLVLGFAITIVFALLALVGMRSPENSGITAMIFEILMFLVFGAGVFFLVFANTRMDNIDKILEENKFTRLNKQRFAPLRAFGSVFIVIS